MHLSHRARAMRSSEIRDLLRLTERSDVISLAGGLPDPGSFPVAELAAAAADLFATDPVSSLQYSTTDGAAELRTWIADRHAAATGRPTTADQVLVTSGSQQALDLLGRVLADPGDEVAAEHPGYLGALQALRAAQLAVGAVPVDRDGLDVAHLGARLAAGWRPRFVYTVPTFQNPTGVTLSDERRRELAALAERHGLVVVEDEPYAPLRFRGEPIAPIAAHSDRVVTLGTFSKILAPGLRLGWMVGPPEVVAAAARAKQATDLHSSGLSQRLALGLVTADGWFDRHVARVAAAYRERADALRGALLAALGDRFSIAAPDGGMFLWATPRPGAAPLDTRALLSAALDHGTAVVPGSAFAATDPTESGAAALAGCMRLSFATWSPAQLTEAAARLARAVAALERTRVPDPV